MIDLKEQIISYAKAMHSEIYPCGEKTSLYDCFTYEKTIGKLIFWFNISGDGSTHSISLPMRDVD